MCAQWRIRSAWASAQSDAQADQSSLSAWRKLWSLATHWAHSEDSDQTAHMPFCWFCHEVAQISFCKHHNSSTNLTMKAAAHFTWWLHNYDAELQHFLTVLKSVRSVTKYLLQVARYRCQWDFDIIVPFSVKQIRRVFDDNWRIIYVSSK